MLDWVNLYALAVNEENAAGGRVVTAPTNGAAGIIPAVLYYHVSLDKVIKTMRETGADMLTKHKETARGGLAVNIVAC